MRVICACHLSCFRLWIHIGASPWEMITHIGILNCVFLPSTCERIQAPYEEALVDDFPGVKPHHRGLGRRLLSQHCVRNTVVITTIYIIGYSADNAGWQNHMIMLLALASHPSRVGSEWPRRVTLWSGHHKRHRGPAHQTLSSPECLSVDKRGRGTDTACMAVCFTKNVLGFTDLPAVDAYTAAVIYSYMYIYVINDGNRRQGEAAGAATHTYTLPVFCRTSP